MILPPTLILPLQGGGNLKCARRLEVNTTLVQVTVADSFLKRLFGLLSQKKLSAGEGLLLSPCKAVHTFFMGYDIDLVFLDEQNKIVKLVERLKPYRAAGCLKATAVLELSAGSINNCQVKTGEQLLFESIT